MTIRERGAPGKSASSSHNLWSSGVQPGGALSSAP